MSAWSSCGPAEVRADAVLPRLAARDDRPLRQPQPLRAHALPHVDVRVAQHHARARHTASARSVLDDAAAPWCRARGGRRARPSGGPGPGWKSRDRRARSSTPSSSSTTTPSTRRSSPHTFSTSSASCRPSTKIRDPLATRALAPCTARDPHAVREATAAASASCARAAAVGGVRMTGRAVEQEARAEREALGAAAPVLEVHDVHAAGLLDPHHGAAPAGLDVLDDQAGLGRHLAGAAPRRDLPVAGRARRSHSGRTPPRGYAGGARREPRGRAARAGLGPRERRRLGTR